MSLERKVAVSNWSTFGVNGSRRHRAVNARRVRANKRAVRRAVQRVIRKEMFD